MFIATTRALHSAWMHLPHIQIRYLGSFKATVVCSNQNRGSSLLSSVLLLFFSKKKESLFPQYHKRVNISLFSL